MGGDAFQVKVEHRAKKRVREVKKKARPGKCLFLT